MENIFDFKTDKINKTKFGSYCINGIPDGCKYCIYGEKLVLFITGVCKTGCRYCPLSEKRKGKNITWANEREIKSIDEIILEAKESNAKGAGITGGDPLIELNKTINYCRALKNEFSKDFHIHIYLSTKLVNKNNLKLLSEVIDEVRFHPEFLEKDSNEILTEDIEKIKLASEFFKKENIGIEIPIFPDIKEKTFEFIKKVSPFISFVNLNELELGDTNFDFICDNYNLNEKGYTIKDSIKTGLWILDKCKKENLNLLIHLCTAETKNWYQYKNRLLKHNILPFGKRTNEGTVIYNSIYESNNKNYIILKNELNGKDFYHDDRKKRIIINPKLLKKFIKDFKITRTEEFPTYEQDEVDFNVLNSKSVN